MEYGNTVDYEKKDPGQVGLHEVELARSESDDIKDTKEHLFDGNYDPAAVVRTPSTMDDEIEEDSPYPEVRAAVSNMDDPTMIVNTWRVWFLGMFWAIIMAGVNQVRLERSLGMIDTDIRIRSSSFSDTLISSSQPSSPSCCPSQWESSWPELCPTSGDSTPAHSTSRSMVSPASVPSLYLCLAISHDSLDHHHGQCQLPECLCDRHHRCAAILLQSKRL